MSTNLFLLVYLLVFVPLLMMRPLWPFRFKRRVSTSPESVWRMIGDQENVPSIFPDIDDFRVLRDPDDPDLFHCPPEGAEKGIRIHCADSGDETLRIDPA